MKKLIGMFVCMLLIAATATSVIGVIDNDENILENHTSIETKPQFDVTIGDDDWPMFRHDPENTGYSTSFTPQTNAIKWTYFTNQEVTSSPAVVNGKVYIGSFDENLYCLDADTGQRIWNHPIPGLGACSPAVYDGKVYIDSAYDYFYCLNADTGGLVWTFYKDYRFSRPAPVVVEGKVFFAHSRGGGDPELEQNATLYCLDADTGDKLWDYHWGWVELSSPAAYKDKVFIGSEDYKFYCFDADTGDILWMFQTFGKVLSSPAVINENVYFGSADGKLYCLNASTGDEIWNFMTGRTFCSPAVAYGNVYIGNEYGETFFCLNASTGDEIWNYPASGGFSFSSPAVADGKVYIATYESRRLLCLDAQSGDFYWSYTLSYANHITSSPAIAYGRIYIGGGMSFKVYCFDDPSKPPSNPTINGPIEVILDYEQKFRFMATDPEDDDIKYYIDWGDGTNSGWIGPYSSGRMITIKHNWSEIGSYKIMVRAEDTYGIKSHWSEHTVSVINAPALEIRLIKGGALKVSTNVRNLGSKEATDVNWSINLDGGFILLGKESFGIIDYIPISGEATINSGIILGFGPTSVYVNVTVPVGLSDSRMQKGFVFLFFIKVNPSG